MIILIPQLCFATSSSDLFREQLKSLTKNNEPSVAACTEQTKKIIQAYKENEDPNGLEVFIEDEKEALTYIENFNTDIIFLKNSQNSYILYHEKYCSNENAVIYDEFLKNTDQCSSLVEYFHFMRALVIAVNKYDWKAETKLKAKDLLIRFLDAFSSNDAPWVTKGLALSVITQMVDNGLLKKEIGKQSKILQSKFEKRVQIYQKMTDLKKSKNRDDFCKTQLKGLKFELKNNSEFSKDLYKLIAQMK